MFKKSVWMPIADAIGQLMLGYTSQSLLALIAKRTCDKRHDLHHELHHHFSSMEINTNETFSMHLEFAHGNATQNRDAPGRIGYVHPLSENIFRDCALLSGIIDAPVRVGCAADSGGALAGGEDAETVPSKGYGSASQALRLANVPEDSWMKVAAAAYTNAAPPPSPAGGLRLKNARGLPLAVVVFWDPSAYSAIDAILAWKKAEAGWRAGEEERVDYRCLLLPFDPQRESELRTYAMSAGSRAWSRGEFVIDSDAAEPPQANQEQIVPDPPLAEPTLDVCRILPNGKLDAKMPVFQAFLENEVTQPQAEARLRKFVQRWAGDGAPCLPPRAEHNAAASGEGAADAAVAGLQGERLQVVTRTLDAPGPLAEVERQHGPWKVDIVLPNAKMRVMISNLGRGFAVAVAAHKVLKDSTFLLPGNGGFRSADDTARDDKTFGATAALNSDADEVLYWAGAPRDKPKARLYTIYGLLAKLSLEGFPDISLNCHEVEAQAGASTGGLGRFKVSCVQAREWKPKKTKKRKGDEEEPVEKAAGEWDAKDAAACLCDISQIPNQYVKIVWYCDLATKPEPLLRLVSPALCWANSYDFQENQVVQFA